MKRFKIINKTPRLQEYVGNPVDLYFLVCESLNEDVYKFNRLVGCHSYKDSKGCDMNTGMIYRGNVEAISKYKTPYYYRRSLKSRKRMYKKTLRSQVIRRCYDY